MVSFSLTGVVMLAQRLLHRLGASTARLAGGFRRPSAIGHTIRATRLHVGLSCCRSHPVRLSLNRERRSRRVVAICVRCICAAACAAVECRAAAWGAGRGGGCATITITHSIRASRASRAHSTASRGAATVAATGRTAIAAVGSRHGSDGRTRQHSTPKGL